MATQRRFGPLCAILLVSHTLLAAQPAARAAFAARTDQVGYKACVHLMIRLIDCLLDASDLYLREMLGPLGDEPLAGGPTGTAPAGPEPLAVGAIKPAPGEKLAPAKDAPDLKGNAPLDGPKGKGSPMKLKEEPSMKGKKAELEEPPEQTGKEPKQRQKEKKDKAMADEMKDGLKDMKDARELKEKPAQSTTPKSFLDWLTGVDTCDLHEEALKSPSGKLELSTSGGCPVESIRRLRTQLLELRAQLVKPEKVSLAQVLRRFSELNSQLRRTCRQPPEGDMPKLDSLSYIMEAVQVLAQMAQAAQIQEGLEQAGDEHAATETIKKHYAYLTQIITSYNLVFNAIDSDLMGPKEAPAADNDAVKKPDKLDKRGQVKGPLLA